MWLDLKSAILATNWLNFKPDVDCHSIEFYTRGVDQIYRLGSSFQKGYLLNTRSFRALFHASEMVGHLTKYIQFRGNNGKGETGKVTYGSQRKEVSLWKYDEQNGRGGKFAGRWKTWDIALTVSVLVPPFLPSMLTSSFLLSQEGHSHLHQLALNPFFL